VELGKTLAPGILNALEGGANTEPSLHGLLDHIHSRR
jgi:hypothetical protein